MSKVVKVGSVAATLAMVAAATSPAAAFERGYPGFSQTPSALQNLPATTAPPGLYGTIVSNITILSIQGPGATTGTPANGEQPSRQFVAAPVEALTYVPGFNILGGVFSVNAAQQETVNTQTAPPATVFGRFGFHNTFLTGFLGYKLGDSGFYMKPSFGVVIPNGTVDGSTQNGLGNVGVRFVTLRIGLGIQYISHGWSFVNNILAEYNTTNPLTGYQTGTILRDEATLTRTFGRLTLGPSIGWIGQVTNDSPGPAFYGSNVIFSQRYGQLGVGGFIGYDFGPVSISAFGLRDILTYANGGSPSVIPAIRGHDTAITTGGETINVAVSFKIPGIGALGQPVDFGAIRDIAN